MFNFSDKKHTLHSVKWLVILILALVFITFGWWGSARLISIVTLVMIYLAMAQVWNLLSGFAGLTSLGHQAFFGIGGYVLALVGQKFKISIWWSFIIAVVICVLFALIISVPIFKMSGVYFTIGTWIVAEALCTLFLNWGFVNYGIGYTISAALKVPIWLLYLMSAILGIGMTVLLVFIMRSKLGMSLRAIRDNTSAAEVRGIKIFNTKLIVFLISAAVMALCGIVMYINQIYITPKGAFSIDWTIAMVFICIIGGSGTIEGPIVGAFVYVILNQILYNFPGYSNLIMGAIAVIVIILAPKGIMGYLGERFHWDIFDIRRRLSR